MKIDNFMEFEKYFRHDDIILRKEKNEKKNIRHLPSNSIWW